MDDSGKEKGKMRWVGYILNIIILHHIAKLSKLGYIQHFMQNCMVLHTDLQLHMSFY